ncbi:MAG: LacI family DNA-binding transcriptional regulator [Rhizobiaceae bacterium]
MRKVSITDVAKRAGCSNATASYALNDGGRVAKLTREKVLKAAAELGFIPDRSAIRLRTGKSNQFGAIINDINNPFFAELVSEFEVEAWNTGYLTILATSQDDPERQKQLIESMVSQGVAGVIVSPVHGSHVDDLRPFKLRSIPYLVCVRDINDEDGGLVIADDFEAGVTAARHAIKMGHRHIGFIGGYEHTATWQRRLGGMHQAAADMGCDNLEIDLYPGSEGPDFGATVVRGLVKSGSGATMVIGLNDDTAIGAYLAARELGIQIGKELSVIGFDNIPQTNLMSPAMTTVELFPREMGRQCAHQLTRLLGAGQKRHEKIKISPVLIERGSVARV